MTEKTFRRLEMISKISKWKSMGVTISVTQRLDVDLCFRVPIACNWIALCCWIQTPPPTHESMHATHWVISDLNFLLLSRDQNQDLSHCNTSIIPKPHSAIKFFCEGKKEELSSGAQVVWGPHNELQMTQATLVVLGASKIMPTGCAEKKPGQFCATATMYPSNYTCFIPNTLN